MNTPIAFLFYLLGLIQLCEVYEIEKLGKVDTMITITNRSDESGLCDVKVSRIMNFYDDASGCEDVPRKQEWDQRFYNQDCSKDWCE